MSEIVNRFEPLFNPESLALIGASTHPEKWGFVILSNILNGHFKGKIYTVNPNEKEILGLKTYPSIEALPETPDLAVLVIPPSSVPPVLKKCTKKGIKAGIIITAGFAEVGTDGESLQEEMVRIVRKGGMILVGPNCFGIISTTCNLVTIMPPLFPKLGPFAIVSQSGNVAASITRRLHVKGFGISRLVSSGNEADLHCEDYFEYLGEDPETKVILSYIEGFKNGRRFFETAKRVTQKKPIVMLKVGHTAAGARAAKSHTAALAGSDSTFNAACKQAGIIRVQDLDEMFNVGVALLHQPLPKGRRVGIVTAGGGWGVLAADACANAGLEVTQLSEETLTELDSFLPSWWSRSNPVDLVAGTGEDVLTRSAEALLRCADIDGVIVLGLMPSLPRYIMSPSDKSLAIPEMLKVLGDALGEIFDQFMALAARYSKPVIVGSEFPFGDGTVDSRVGEAAGQKGTACYSLPSQAAIVLSSLAQYAEYLREAR